MHAPVLALDLASVSGWACGEPGGEPVHGSHRFASPGASHEAIFAKAMEWAETKIAFHRPRLIVWEAPLAGFKGGKTTVDVSAVLFGLPAIFGAVAYQHGIYDCRKAETSAVRNHFIGSNPKRAKAKPLVMETCRRMGWEVEDDNEADALAVWSYMCSLIDPVLALAPTPLFGRQSA
jgi:crossover junction endodeoxyribonuclease RuvC